MAHCKQSVALLVVSLLHLGPYDWQSSGLKIQACCGDLQDSVACFKPPSAAPKSGAAAFRSCVGVLTIKPMLTFSA